MASILHAEWLIRRRPMDTWRGSLGLVVMGGGAEPLPERHHFDGRPSSQQIAAASAARRVKRAASRLPYEVKCLPQAMALQWRLKDAGLPSRLVIARHADLVGLDPGDENRPDAFHAWVELDDAMLIGECERTEYQVLMSFHFEENRAHQPCDGRQ